MSQVRMGPSERPVHVGCTLGFGLGPGYPEHEPVHITLVRQEGLGDALVCILIVVVIRRRKYQMI